VGIDKVMSSREEAIADIFDGATIMIGGWAGWSGIPIGLIRALRNKGTKNISLIAINSGGQIKYPSGEWADHAALAEGGQLRKVTCCWTRPAGLATDPIGPATRQAMEGTLELEMVPQGTLVERIRAGGAGIGGFYTGVGIGTVVERGKEKKTIDGKEYILETSLTADFALIRAYKADRMGNLIYRGTARGISHAVATAAKTTIVEAEVIVEVGELDPETIHTPGIHVDRIVQIAKEEILWRRKNLA